MRIAIAGCGIAGTSAAILLVRQGHEVHIFEQAPDCKPVGAGILLQLPGQQVLKKLGIFDEVIGQSAALDGLWARQTNGKTLVRLKYEWLGDNSIGYGVHRGTLFQSLHQKCLAEGVHISNNFRAVETNYDAASKASLTSDNGTHVGGFDFVIGADGSRSALREHMGLTKYVVDYDYAALWSTGHSDYQPGTLLQVVRGSYDLVGLLPIGQGQSSFFYGLPVADYEAVVSQPIEPWKASVLEICSDAESILKSIDSFEDLTYASYRHVVSKAWHKEYFLLLGDAGHATSPHLGQGVSLALEDADCFASCLGESGNFESACRSFSQRRRWKVRYFQQLTMFLSPFFQSNSILRGSLRDTFLPWFPYLPLVRQEMIRTLRGSKSGWIG